MKTKRLLLALLVLLVTAATVFAQTGAAGRGRSGGGSYTLSINSNVRGAQVFVNAVRQKAVTPMNLTLSAGSYSITVRADGYKDYTANVNLTRDLTINATLEPITHTLMVTSNVKGSEVYVDGQRRGAVPTRLTLPQGSYSITVEANNYHPFTTSVSLSSDMTVNAQLEPKSFRLNVTANVQGADVYLGGDRIGRTPLQVEVTPGTYALRLVAPGFFESSQTITVADNFNINVNLRKQVSEVTFVVPENVLNPAVKQALRLFELYVDGSRIPGTLNQPFEVDAGEHLIRVQTGGMSFEGRYVFEAGRNYVLEFSPGLLLEPAAQQGR